MPSLSEYERLFLLEFFVDSVYIKNSLFDDVNDSSLCVSFQFLNYPVMLVCEEDFTPKTKSLRKETDIVFKSGKSCLFSLRTDQSNTIPSEFDLIITVIQSMKNNKPPDKSFVAETVIRLGSSFSNLMRSSNTSTLPATNIKQDTFPLKDKNGQNVGQLVAFVRLSCFGKLIVTQFQLANEDNKNYMFKGTDPKKIFPDKDSVIKQPMPVQDGKARTSEEIPGDTPYTDIFGFPEGSEESFGEVKSVETSEEEEREEDDEEEGKEHFERLKKINEKTVSDKQKKTEESEKAKAEEEYKEIGAEINGNSITIRVLKKAKKQKKSSNEDKSSNNGKIMSEEEPDFSATRQVQQERMYTGGISEIPISQLCACQQMQRGLPQPGLIQEGTTEEVLQGGNFTEVPASRLYPSQQMQRSQSQSQKPSFQGCACPGIPPCLSLGAPTYCPQMSSPGYNQHPFQGSSTGYGKNSFQEVPQIYPQVRDPNTPIMGYPVMPATSLPQCPKEDCPLGLYNQNSPQNIMELEPGTVAMKGDQVFFQMANRSPGEPISEKEQKLANSLYYKVGSTEAGKEPAMNTVQILPQNPGEPISTGPCVQGRGPLSGLAVDNNKQDMFLLKVQQNSDNVEARSKLEMELRTPKTTEPKPDSYSKNTQSDFPLPEKKPIPEKAKKKKKKK